MNWMLLLYVVLLVLLTLVGLFIVTAAVAAIWRSLHEQELLRLRRFRDDVMFEAVIAESVSGPTLQRIASNHEVSRG